jgi:hypothetical protein
MDGKLFWCSTDFFANEQSSQPVFVGGGTTSNASSRLHSETRSKRRATAGNFPTSVAMWLIRHTWTNLDVVLLLLPFCRKDMVSLLYWH